MRRVLCRVAAASWYLIVAGAALEESGMRAIFDGKSLSGWRRANEPGHASGCVWEVREGSISGRQEYPGAWGILYTEETFADFELAVEVKAEAPFDGGIIVRATPEGHGYLVTIRPEPGGEVGGIAASRIPEFHEAPSEWRKAWREGWNELRIAVSGQPPEIRTWLNGEPMASRKDLPVDPRVAGAGRIALKVAGEEPCFGEALQFRNIRVRQTEKKGS